MTFKREYIKESYERGVRKVHVYYGGSGDSGGIETVEIINPEDMEFIGEEESIFTELADEIITDNDAYFEDDGCQGDIYFTLKADGTMDYKGTHEVNVMTQQTTHSKGKF